MLPRLDRGARGHVRLDGLDDVARRRPPVPRAREHVAAPVADAALARVRIPVLCDPDLESQLDYFGKHVQLLGAVHGLARKLRRQVAELQQHELALRGAEEQLIAGHQLGGRRAVVHHLIGAGAVQVIAADARRRHRLRFPVTAVDEISASPVGVPQGPGVAQRQRAGQGEPVQLLEHRRGDKGGGLEVLQACGLPHDVLAGEIVTAHFQHLGQGRGGAVAVDHAGIGLVGARHVLVDELVPTLHAGIVGPLRVGGVLGIGSR